MSRRNEQLRAVAEEFVRVHAAWVDAENRPHPDETYWDAVDNLRRAFARGDIPDESRDLNIAVSGFLEEVDAYDNREQMNDLEPHPEFWTARQGIETALSPPLKPSRKPLESIASLAAGNVSHLQIAKIYGFRDRGGEWMPSLVQKEIDQPGSVLKDPAGVDGRAWVDPRVTEEQSATVASSDAAERATAKKETRKTERAKADGPPCKETPRELWQQNVPIRQAALMLRTSEDEVAESFAGFEKERDAELAGESDGPAKNGDATAQTICEMFQAGKKPGEIVRELRVDPERVKKALAGLKTEAAA